MASAFGPGMQPFVGPQNMNRQDIARLTNFDKVLLEWQRQVGAGGQPPSIDEVRAKYEETIFEPMVTTWLSTPDTAAGVIRFVVAGLGAEFSAAEVQSQIAESGFGKLLSQVFMDALVGLDESTPLNKDELLHLFYEHHSEELPSMPGEITERATKYAPTHRPGSCADRYARLGGVAESISSHRVFRAMIGILIVTVVLITGVENTQGSQQDTWMRIIEFVIILVFVSEVVLKVVAQGTRPWRFFLVPPLPGTAPYSPHSHWQSIFNVRHWLAGIQGWNIFDLLVVAICVVQWFATTMTSNMVVLRMVRLIKVLQLFYEVDQIRAIMIGLGGGLHSLVFVALVFSVIFYVYGLVGIHLFGVTDEFHFASMFYTVVTMCRMAMGPWQDVMFINLYGCLDDRAHLPTPQVQEVYCARDDHPGSAGINNDPWRQAAVYVYFLSFKIICGFVALSLLFGVITTAMSKALAETNKGKFEALRQKRQEGAQKQLLRRRNAARMEAEVDTVRRYATKWWTITGKIEVQIETVDGVPDVPGRPRRRRVYVKQAKDLACSDGSEKQPKPGDPYVTVYWNDRQLYKSDVVYNSVNPAWDESGVISIPRDGGVLRAEVFDWDADEAVLPGVQRCDSFQGEASVSIGVDAGSLGGPDCAPASKFYKLTEHIVQHATDADILIEAANAAAVRPKERTLEQKRAVCQVLQTIRWFQVNCPNPDALMNVAKYVKRKDFAKGEVLYEHGASAKSMLVVFSGNVVLKQPSGKVVARMGGGSTLGERALMGDMDELMENVFDDYGSDSDQEDEFDASKRYCTAVASTDAVVGRLSRDKFYSVPNRRAGFGGMAATSGALMEYKKLSLEAFKFANEDWFHWLVLGCILVQAVVLGLEVTVRDHTLIDESNKPIWASVNFILRLIFTVEVIMKVIAFLNPWQEWAWFSDPWTLFDTAIVMISWVPNTPEGLLILRVLRLFRVLKEFNSLPQLQMIVNGLIDALTGLWFVLLLLALILYFYSIIGLQMFGENDYRFKSLDDALLALSSTATEGSWPNMMYTNMFGCRDYYTKGHRCCDEELGNTSVPFDFLPIEEQEKCPEHQPMPISAAVYFISFRLLVTFVILKLVVGTIISSMQAESKVHDETVEIYKAVKLLCAQYEIGHAEMRTWMEAIQVMDQFSHGFINTEQVDGVIELLQIHLDEDLNYKLHWHLLQSEGEQIHITEFVEYLCIQNRRVRAAKADQVDAHPTALQDSNSRLTTFSNPVASVGLQSSAE